MRSKVLAALSGHMQVADALLASSYMGNTWVLEGQQEGGGCQKRQGAL